MLSESAPVSEYYIDYESRRTFAWRLLFHELEDRGDHLGALKALVPTYIQAGRVLAIEGERYRKWIEDRKQEGRANQQRPEVDYHNLRASEETRKRNRTLLERFAPNLDSSSVTGDEVVLDVGPWPGRVELLWELLNISDKDAEELRAIAGGRREAYIPLATDPAEPSRITKHVPNVKPAEAELTLREYELSVHVRDWLAHLNLLCFDGFAHSLWLLDAWSSLSAKVKDYRVPRMTPVLLRPPQAPPPPSPPTYDPSGSQEITRKVYLGRVRRYMRVAEERNHRRGALERDIALFLGPKPTRLGRDRDIAHLKAREAADIDGNLRLRDDIALFVLWQVRRRHWQAIADGAEIGRSTARDRVMAAADALGVSLRVGRAGRPRSR